MSRKDEAVLARLNTIGPPPNITADQQMRMENLGELLSIHRGNRATLESMTPELLDLDLERAVPSVSVPVFFYLGRHDRQSARLLQPARGSPSSRHPAFSA